MINWALMSIPIASLINVWPVVTKVSTIMKYAKIDNKQGRGNLEEMKDKIPREDYQRALRASKAEANFHENFPLFVGSVLIANFSNVPKDWSAQLAIAWLGARVVYNFAYINGTTDGMSYIRSLAFFVNLGISLALSIRGARNAW
eukprot:Plantae.Rhodophyta-Purpureofilum_apyrenoidigerum.ctg6845.p1 GENE.Plantae.Rhodophyta-Purpureofilum_apyrenoidigerum.ctg6845~~Plantae.Rhodophyta-Purpureofilum_apyrenoidigerum.ctg6845.p1  ORF type:complete len:145 (-),score=26.57 Plantae.Rhodophyta-Purpureofilum_apyrenoidigerum.ctg6845:116-550(-)